MLREIRSAVADRERRFIPNTASGVAVRAKADQAKTIEGYGALYNSETVIGMWFREVILPGAFTDSVKNDDIRVFFNHDPNYILGRTSAGTATVDEDEGGLRYAATPPAARADVVESIERKDVTGSSFQFSIEGPDDEEWDYSEIKQGKLPLRKILKARLYETGPVAFPAYEDTTVSARAKDKVEEGLRQVEAARAAAGELCGACKGSGLNPERQMSDPKGQAPCDACKGSGKRTEPAPFVPADVLAQELDLLELD